MQKTSATPAASTGSRLVPASSMNNRLHTGRLPQLFSAGVRLTAILAALACLLNASPATAGQAGIDWTIQNMGFDLNWFSVTYGNGLFVAVAGNGTGNRVMTSPDGTNWTARTSAADNTWDSVTYGNGIFVAVAQSGIGNRVMTSPTALIGHRKRMSLI